MNRKGDGFKSVLIYICLFVVFLAFVVFQRGGINTSMQTEVYTYSSLMSQLKSGDIDSITLQKDADIIDSGTATVVRNDGRTYTVDIISVSQFVDRISDMVENGDVELITEDTPNTGNWISVISTIVVVVIGLLLLFFVMQQMQGGGGGKVMNFGKSNAKLNNDPNNKKTFADVAGLDEEKEEVQEIVQFLKNPKKFTDIGARTVSYTHLDVYKRQVYYRAP